MLDHPGAFSAAHGGPKMTQNSTKMALYDPKWAFMAQNDALRKSLHDQKWLFITQNVSAWLKMALKKFSGHNTWLYAIWDHSRKKVGTWEPSSKSIFGQN